MKITNPFSLIIAEKEGITEVKVRTIFIKPPPILT